MNQNEKTIILEELKAITNTKERFVYLINLGKKEPDLKEEEKNENNRIKGCNSLLWLVASFEKGKVFFKVDSDASIPKGLGTLISKIYSGLTPAEILSTNIKFLEELDITQHLSMNRRNGLAHIIKQINYYAIAFQAKVKLV